MDIVKSESDLEDGEIRDDVLEDISDCSISDIIHEDFIDDNNLDSLRNEALKSLQVEQPTNEEEKCRLEALKSLLENTGFLNDNDESLQGIDDLTEEEKFRVEAVKSLLRNINFLTTKSTPPPVSNRTKKHRRRKKIKKGDSPQKRIKVEETLVEDIKPDVPYLEETTSLLSELSEDVKKINECIEIKKSEVNIDTNLVNKENIENDSVNESSIVVNSVRSWYPKTEFTLLDKPIVRNIGVKRNKRIGQGVKPQSNNSRILKPDNESIANHCEKTEPIIERLESSNTELSIKLDELPKQEPLNDTIDVNVPVEKLVVSEKPLELKPTAIENVSVCKKPTRALCDVQGTKKLKKTSHQIIRPNVLIRSPKSKPIVAKISTPCSFRKINSVQPVPNGKTFSFVRKPDRYKLNNVPTSKFTIKKGTMKIDKTKSKLNNAIKSRYSINRTNQYSKVNAKEFIIPLNDDDRDDSSKEEDVLVEPVVAVNSSETHLRISLSVKIGDEKDVPKIKEEPQEAPEELPNDEFLSTSTESPSTTTADPVPFVKEEPLPEAADEFDVSRIEIEDVCSLKCDTSSRPSSQDLPIPSNDKSETKTELDVLLEAEENLIEIRSKLLSSLGELDTSIKTNGQEKERLLNMVKKLNLLRAAVTKFEDKIKTQKMKLAMSNSFTQSLYEGVMLRSKTCAKMKDLCSMAGKKIVGPLYRPPEDFEVQLEEKQKTLDFSKYVQKPAEKK